MKSKFDKNYFINFIISGIFVCGIPLTLLVLDYEKNVVISSILIGAVFVVLWNLIVNILPQKKLGKYLARLIKGDIGLTTPKIPFCSNFKQFQKEIEEFVDSTLGGLINDLKMEILHTQDSSDIFLEEVQRAVTNSSRISLGADYIDSRVENLDKLLNDSLKENAGIQKNINDYTKKVQDQTSSIAQTAAVLENIEKELKASITNLDTNKQISRNMILVTEDCGGKIKQTVEAISKISDAIDVANGTIELVDNIAQQTNLLAMNAAIEAAHAGESGKGFAVVATEIRKLAETTSKQVSTITDSLKRVTEIVDITTRLGNETGTAFLQISEQTDKFIKVFDNVIEDFSNLGQNNEQVYKDFNKIQQMNNRVSTEMNKITKKIDDNNVHLNQIHVCSEEIKNIVQRNAEESIQLSKGQVPVYYNVIQNAKHLESIRKSINAFRVKNVPLNVWESDKTELNLLIDAIYNHLEWTVAMLKFIHGEDDSMSNQLAVGTTRFDKWFYGFACKKYVNHPSLENIKNIDISIHEKAILIGKLKNAGKAQSATIEFSEILEQSRALRSELNILKKHIIKLNINPATPDLKQPDQQEKTNTLDTVEEAVAEKKDAPNLEMVEPQEDIFNSLETVENLEAIDDVEELEELEDVEDIADIEPVEKIENVTQEKENFYESLDDSEYEEVTDFY